MKKFSKLLLVLLMVISVGKVYAGGSNVMLEDYFVKKDDKGNLIDDAEFVQTTLNGDELAKIVVSNNQLESTIGPGLADGGGNDITLQVPKVKAGISGKYYYVTSIHNKDLAYKTLTSEQKAIFDKMTTLNYYLSVRNNFPEYISTCDENFANQIKSSKGISVNETYNSPADAVSSINLKPVVKKLQASDGSDISSLSFAINTFTFIDETKTPVGLEKQTIVVPLVTILNYVVNEDGTLTLESGESFDDNRLPFMKSNFEIDYNKVGDVYANMSTENIYGTTCGTWSMSSCSEPQFSGEVDRSVDGDIKLRVPDVKVYMNGENCPALVVDKTSTEDLSKKVEISTKVNGQEKIQVKKNERVDVSVLVNNGAKTPLYTNKIVSKIPKDLVYVDGSAQKGGVYDAKTQTITWELDYLDAYDSTILTYQVDVPSTLDDGAVRTTEASITTFGSDTPIVSDEAQVDYGNKTTDKVVNPETGILSEEALYIVLGIAVFATLYIVRKNSIQSI